jgi:hypothetical protein
MADQRIRDMRDDAARSRMVARARDGARRGPGIAVHGRRRMDRWVVTVTIRIGKLHWPHGLTSRRHVLAAEGSDNRC